MDKDSHRLYVDSVQHRYHYLNLTFEQANKIFQHEEINGFYSVKHHFSVWEEWDFEFLRFSQILDPDQLQRYQEFIEPIKQQTIEDMARRDGENATPLNITRAKIDYLKNDLIPSILSDRSNMIAAALLMQERSKTNYLRACYKTFLEERRKEVIVGHVRSNRTFKPIELKTAMLSHYILCLFPDYVDFERNTDEPTRAIAKFIQSKIGRLPPDVAEFRDLKMQEYKDFDRLNFEKFSRPMAGWHTRKSEPPSEDDEKMHWSMALLLLDKDAFGFEEWE